MHPFRLPRLPAEIGQLPNTISNDGPQCRSVLFPQRDDRRESRRQQLISSLSTAKLSRALNGRLLYITTVLQSNRLIERKNRGF